MPTPPLHVVQITDTHLFADEAQEMFGLRTNLSLQAVLNAVQQLQTQPDLLLLTGDLSQDETTASYKYLQTRVQRLNIPTYWLPGNHDQDEASLEQVLSGSPLRSDKSFCQGNWQFILLNSMLTGQVQGRLSSESLLWLEQQLQSTDRPTLIAIHHPPVLTGAAWMDAIGLENPEDFFAVIDRFSHVKLVLFGHIHQAFSSQRQDVYYFGCPSSCVQFQPNSPEFAIDQQPPGFRLVSLYADGRFETQVQRVELSVNASF
jgi:Icc protein